VFSCLSKEHIVWLSRDLINLPPFLRSFLRESLVDHWHNFTQQLTRVGYNEFFNKRIISLTSYVWHWQFLAWVWTMRPKVHCWWLPEPAGYVQYMLRLRDQENHLRLHLCVIHNGFK
jgi:hypothetical protein